MSRIFTFSTLLAFLLVTPAAHGVQGLDILDQLETPYNHVSNPNGASFQINHQTFAGIQLVTSLTPGEFERATHGFVAVQPGVELHTKLNQTFMDGRTFVVLQQMHEGLEVLDTQVIAQFDRGMLVQVKTRTQPTVNVPDAVLDAEAAETAAWNDLAVIAPVDVTQAARRAVYQGRPVWVTTIECADPFSKFEVVVDAVDGSILRRRNQIYHATVRLLGEVEERTIGDPLVQVGLLRTRGSGSDVTNIDALADITGTQFDAQMVGPNFTLIDDSGQPESTRLFNLTGAVPVEVLTWRASEAPNTQLAPWYYANRTNSFGRFHSPDLPWLNANVPLHVNLNQSCNAHFDGAEGSINFYTAGSESGQSCNNTGRIFDVVAHEWGHGFHLNRSLGQMVSEIQEGVADYISVTATNDPNMAPGFLTNGGGIRNVGPDRRYPDNLTGQVHNDGLIWGSTWWDLRSAMIDKYGYAEGVHITDVLHSNVVRGGPDYQSVYGDAIVADDNDANPNNGSPNSCEINAVFSLHGLQIGTQRPGTGNVQFTHGPLGTPYPSVAIEVSTQAVAPTSQCGNLVESSLTLHYTSDRGATFNQVALGSNGGSDYVANLPAHPDNTFVQYYFSGTTDDTSGLVWTEPRHAPSSMHGFYVGKVADIARFDFEAGDQGWTHGEANDVINDDWEVGTPGGRGWDPDHAYSGVNAFGNDLGNLGNGHYSDLVYNWLVSPDIDCGSCKNTRLQFRRWLNLAAGDAARIKVNGFTVFEEETNAIHDQHWVYYDIDISEYADGQETVSIAFELQSGLNGNFGGWNLDDVAVVVAGASGSTSLDGGCTCALTKQSDSIPLGSAVLALLLAAGALVVRRRT